MAKKVCEKNGVGARTARNYRSTSCRMELFQQTPLPSRLLTSLLPASAHALAHGSSL